MKNSQTSPAFEQYALSNSYLNSFQTAQLNLSLLIKEERLLKRLRKRKRHMQAA